MVPNTKRTRSKQMISYFPLYFQVVTGGQYDVDVIIEGPQKNKAQKTQLYKQVGIRIYYPDAILHQ